MNELLVFTFSFAATLFGVALFRRFGPASRMMDIPNERSSHSVPTPRGAGVVIVIVCLLVYAAIAAVSGSAVNWSYIIGAIVIAVVSWIDDLSTLPAYVRFAAHSLAAGILILGSGVLGGIAIPGAASIEFGVLAPLITLGWIVWMINSYNFMDGIDGIAGGQAVVAGLSWAIFGFLSNEPLIYLYGGSIAFAALGFLFHNWSPAKVFMGDVGSAFLGYTFAAVPLLVGRSAEHGSWLFLAAVTFVWVFFFDSVYTFIRRSLKWEKVWIAHRQHIYQRLVIFGWKHSSVSLFYTTAAAAVSAAFFLAYLTAGISSLLLIFSYIVSAGLLAALARVKKV